MSHSPDFEDKNSMLILLRSYLTPNPDGTYTYDLEWSDLLVAEAANPNTKFKAYHAAAIRRKKFGVLKRKKAAAATLSTPEPSRMDIFEARLSRIIDILAANSPRSAQHRRYLLDGTSATAHLDDI